MPFFLTWTNLILSATLAASPPGASLTARGDSLAPIDTTQVILTDAGIKQLTTFWTILLREPYNRRIMSASKGIVHAITTDSHRAPKQFTPYFINLPLAAPYLKALAPALDSARLTIPQVQALLWSWQMAFAKINADTYATGFWKERDPIYLPNGGDTTSILGKNVAFVYARGGLPLGPNGPRRSPIDLEGVDINAVDHIGLLDIYALGGGRDSPAPDTTPVDTAQLVCEPTHPCDLQIMVDEEVQQEGNGGIIRKGSVPQTNVHICVRGTKNCAVSGQNGFVLLTNLSAGEVAVTVRGKRIVDQEATFPVLYRHQLYALLRVIPNK